jgi:hypothetical protein
MAKQISNQTVITKFKKFELQEYLNKNFAFGMASDIGINPKSLNKAWSRGHVKRVDLYMSLDDVLGNRRLGYIYYNNNLGYDQDTIILSWFKINKPEIYKAILFIQENKVTNRKELENEHISDFKTLNFLAKHKRFIKRKNVMGVPTLFFTLSATDKMLDKYLSNIQEVLKQTKSIAVKKGFAFQETVLKTLKKGFEMNNLKVLVAEKEKYIRGSDGNVYKFDLFFIISVGFKMFLPIVVECKNFSLSTSNLSTLAYFSHKTNMCFQNKPVQKIVVCPYAEQRLFSKIYKGMGIWICTLRENRKKEINIYPKPMDVSWS